MCELSISDLIKNENKELLSLYLVYSMHKREMNDYFV